MVGLQIAFKEFNVVGGIWNSPWVGLKHFKEFITSYQFPRLIKNTLGISLYSLIAGFPVPILLAVMINECTNTKFKKAVQLITYAPHFISTVVMVSVVLMLMAPRAGMINNIIALFGGERIDFIAKPEYFKSIYVWSGIWQSMGYNSIIYIAALSGIDPSLYEAATVDGASKLQRIMNIDLPGILPTIIIQLIMQCGRLMNVGHEKVLLMQNNLNMSSSDIISTYVYRIGLENARYSFSAAVGMFNSVINTFLLILVNSISRKVSETSLW
jgi:putative aldouronate transport system permease protein